MSKASEYQINRLLLLLHQGEVDAELAQAIIDQRVMVMDAEPSIPPPPDTDRSDAETWDIRFPGGGQPLMELLQPCYDWIPQLKPAIADLTGHSAKAVIWREPTFSCAVYPRREWDALWNRVQMPLDTMLRMTLGAKFDNPLFRSLSRPIGRELVMRVSELFRASLGAAMWDARSVSIWEGFMATVTLNAIYLLQGQPDAAEKFRPLRELWFAGNYLVGFDANADPVYLVADPPEE